MSSKKDITFLIQYLYMDYVISIIQSVGYFGYGLLFLIIFLESFPITFFLPGDSLLFTIGFLASQGQFNIGLVVLVFFVASFLGYILSFVAGRKLSHMLHGEKKFWLNPKHIQKTHQFFEKYGAKTIIIGRFVPIVRSFSSFIAGAVNMDYKKFLKYTLVGGILWTGGVTSVGFYLGQTFPSLHLHLTSIILLIVFISILPGIFEYISSKRKT